MTHLIIVRHGQSVSNISHLFTGDGDCALSEMGCLQADELAKYLKNKHIDKIYSSDLSRAYNTALPTAKQKGLKIIKEKLLREVNGGLWEGKSYEELTAEYGEDYAVWLEDVGNAHCTGGESVKQLSERVLFTVDKIAAENDGKTVLIATHATPIRCMITKWSGKGFDDMKNVPWVKNASITYVDYENGKYSILSADNCEHLGALISALPSNV